jgi:hypothetical protein
MCPDGNDGTLVAPSHAGSFFDLDVIVLSEVVFDLGEEFGAALHTTAYGVADSEGIFGSV